MHLSPDQMVFWQHGFFKLNATIVFTWGLMLVLAWAAGGGLGVIFFGGLWWTVRKGVSSERPAFWFFGSLLLRMGIVLGGFYFIGRGDWQRIIVCLLGFIIARIIVMRLTRTPTEHSNSPAKEARHAP